MTDNPTYIENATSKIKLYANHGIIPTSQLITTYETKTHPLSHEMVVKNIEFYFR